MNLFSIYLKKASMGKGFTLIELLVVIGILGVLASALVATIDPFEQLKKANDSNAKNTAVEFINANIRYYTTHNTMPWANTSCNSGDVPTAATLGGNAMSGCLTDLVSDGEIKSGFTTVTSVLSSILISGGTNGVTACFQPQSKAQQRDLNTKFDNTGVGTSGCISQPNGSLTTCYWCSQ